MIFFMHIVLELYKKKYELSNSSLRQFSELEAGGHKVGALA